MIVTQTALQATESAAAAGAMGSPTTTISTWSTFTNFVTVYPTSTSAASATSYFYVGTNGTTSWFNGISPPSTFSEYVTETVLVTVYPEASVTSVSNTPAQLSATENAAATSFSSILFSYSSTSDDLTSTSTLTSFITLHLTERSTVTTVTKTSSSAIAGASFTGVSPNGWNSSSGAISAGATGVSFSTGAATTIIESLESASPSTSAIVHTTVYAPSTEKFTVTVTEHASTSTTAATSDSLITLSAESTSDVFVVAATATAGTTSERSAASAKTYTSEVSHNATAGGASRSAAPSVIVDHNHGTAVGGAETHSSLRGYGVPRISKGSGFQNATGNIAGSYGLSIAIAGTSTTASRLMRTVTASESLRQTPASSLAVIGATAAANSAHSTTILTSQTSHHAASSTSPEHVPTESTEKPVIGASTSGSNTFISRPSHNETSSTTCKTTAIVTNSTGSISKTATGTKPAMSLSLISSAAISATSTSLALSAYATGSTFTTKVIPLTTGGSNATTSSTVGSFTNTSTTIAPTPSVCGEHGNFTLNWDDEPSFDNSNENITDVSEAPPVFNPYHHLYFSNGYVYIPPPTDPFPPISEPRLVMFLTNETGASDNVDAGDLRPGEISAGKYASESAFWFNAYSAYLGCDNAGPGDCTMLISGYAYYDASPSDQVLVHQFNATLPPCPGMKNCTLSKVDFPAEFEGLSGIQVEAFKGNETKMWFMDNLSMGWYNNTCAAGLLRQRSQ